MGGRRDCSVGRTSVSPTVRDHERGTPSASPRGDAGRAARGPGCPDSGGLVTETSILIAVLSLIANVVSEAYTLDFALRIVRRWTRIYTALALPDERDDRRCEIESDLYEQMA